jgi:hypothetical protein
MLIAAPSGIGKSFVAMSVIRALTLGVPVFGWDYFNVPEPARVLYMDQEVAPLALQERIGSIFTPEELEATSERFYAVSGHPELSFSSREGFRIISDEVERIKPSVLILDPIANLHNYEENSNTEIGKLFEQIGVLQKIGIAWGMSVIVIHHTGKPPHERSEYDPLSARNMRGASKYESVPDSILMLQRCGILNQEHGAWKLRARFDKLRHSKKFPDFYLKVNEAGDFRVEFEKVDGNPLASGIARMTVGPCQAPEVVSPGRGGEYKLREPEVGTSMTVDIPAGPIVRTF